MYKMGGYGWAASPLPDAPFPEFMYIDYFRYYHLNTTNNLLFQNYPNPAKNIFDTEYIVADSSVSSFIIIYNVLGEKVMSIALTEKGKSKITI